MTEIEVKFGGVIVSVVAPLIVPDFAVIVVLPCVKVVAIPLVLMVAMVVAEEVQVAEAVRFWVVPLL